MCQYLHACVHHTSCAFRVYTMRVVPGIMRTGSRPASCNCLVFVLTDFNGRVDWFITDWFVPGLLHYLFYFIVDWVHSFVELKVLGEMPKGLLSSRTSQQACGSGGALAPTLPHAIRNRPQSIRTSVWGPNVGCLPSIVRKTKKH